MASESFQHSARPTPHRWAGRVLLLVGVAGLVATLVLAGLGALPEPTRPPAAPIPRGIAAVEPLFTPTGIPALLLSYTFASATYTQPYYPTSVFWTDPTTAVLSYQFNVPGGSTDVYVVGIPPNWLFEDAGPGQIALTQGAVWFPTFNATATEGGDLFDLQELGVLPPDPTYVALAGDVSAILASLSSDTVSLGAQVASAQHLIALALQEENATYGYRLSPGTASHAGSIYSLPVFVALLSGGTANATVTAKAAGGLSVAYIDAFGHSATPTWATSSVGTGSFQLAVNLTGTQAAGITSGTSVLTLSSPVTVGTFTNLAGGFVAAPSFANMSSPAGWWSTIFGIQTAPPSTDPATVTDILADLAWFGDSTAGRALYALVTLVSVLVYLVAAHGLVRRKVSGEPGPKRPEGASA